jgi:hypothetical protein
MSADEVFAEVEWLREADMHPAMIATQIGRNPAALEQLARRHGREDIAALFWSEVIRSRAAERSAAKKRKRARDRVQ